MPRTTNSKTTTVTSNNNKGKKSMNTTRKNQTDARGGKKSNAPAKKNVVPKGGITKSKTNVVRRAMNNNSNKEKKQPQKRAAKTMDIEDDAEEFDRRKKKRAGAKNSWRKLTFGSDLVALSRVCDDNIRSIGEYVDDGEDLSVPDGSVDGVAKVSGARNIAAPHGAASVMMKKAFIRTKSSECPKILNDIIKMIITNCAYSSAAVMVASSPGKRSGVAPGEWKPKRCQTDHLRTAIRYATGSTILDVVDDVTDSRTSHKRKQGTQESAVDAAYGDASN